MPLEDLKTIKDVKEELGLKYKVPALYDAKTGKKLKLNEQDYEDINVLLATGAAKLDPNADVDLIDDSGDVYTGKGHQVLEMLQNGFIVDSPARKTIRDVEKILGAPIEQAKTLGEGIASGATGGLSKPALDALGISKASLQRARQAINPLLHLTGEAAGIFLPFGVEATAAKEGAGALAKGAGEIAGYSPMSVIAKAGRAVEDGARGILSEKTAESLLGKVATRGIGGAVEGALGNGIFEISDQMLDKDLSAEHLLASMGEGALFGGGIGAGFAGVEHGITAASKKISKVMDASRPGVFKWLAKGTSTDEDILKEYAGMRKDGIRLEDLDVPEHYSAGYREFLDNSMEELKNKQASLDEVTKNIVEDFESRKSQFKQDVATHNDTIAALKSEIKDAMVRNEETIKATLSEASEKLSDKLDDLKQMSFDESLIRDEWLADKAIDKKQIVKALNKTSEERFGRPFVSGSDGLSEAQKEAYNSINDVFHQLNELSDLNKGVIPAKDFRRNVIKQFDIRIGELKNANKISTEEYYTLTEARRNMSDALHNSLGAEYETILAPIRAKAQAQEEFKKAFKARNLDPVSIFSKLEKIESKDLPLYKKTVLEGIDNVEKTYLDSLQASYEIANNMGDKAQAKALKELIDDAKMMSVKDMVNDAFNQRQTSLDLEKKVFERISDKSLMEEQFLKKQKTAKIKEIEEKLRRKIYTSSAGDFGDNFNEYLYKAHKADIDIMQKRYASLIGSNGKIISSREFNSLYNAAIKGDEYATNRIKDIGRAIHEIDPVMHNKLLEVGKKLGFKNPFEMGDFLQAQKIKAHFERGTKNTGVNNLIMASVIGATLGGFGGGLAGAILTRVFDKSGPQFAKSLIDYYTRLSGVEKIAAHGSSVLADKIDTFFGLESGRRGYAVTQRVRQVLQNDHDSSGKMTVKKFEQVRDEISRLSGNIEAADSIVGGSMTELEQMQAVKQSVQMKAIGKLKYLEKVLPKPPRQEYQFLKPKNWFPSDHDLYKFKRHYDVTVNPYSVFDSLNRGDLTGEQVNTLKEVYPSLYSEAIEHIVKNIAESDGKGLSYEKRQALSMFLGKPLDESLEAGFIIDMQSLHAAQNQLQSNQQQGSKVNPEAASRRMTGTEKTLTRA